MSWRSLSQADQTSQGFEEGFFNLQKRPIEIYIFVDPLCPECWSLEPFIKKLTLEYGRYFKIRPILSGSLTTWQRSHSEKPENLKRQWDQTTSLTGMCCDGDVWIENPVHSPLSTALAVKAAEFQGKKSGMRFLRKVQEYVFLEKQDVSKEEILVECAEKSHIDVEEFKRDLHSETAKRALQDDMKLRQEMEVDETPTIVIFNESEEDAGLKITGLYEYHIYVKVLKDMLQQNPAPSLKPSLEEFMNQYRFVANKEIAVVYDWTEKEARREMRKLVLKQKVQEIPVKHGVFWEYIR
ncbi:ClpXP adapter SpxH family protein [Salimicrobium jeotgali]|uniref:ClpXP adapter SpxH family protein n=1 Tax=Salimicrobium jeotgali TaxID=1230341 RepID=UPI000C838E6C|nr:ClpXP adapter SpxH family protein [Salimicrobium jeotgali]